MSDMTLFEKLKWLRNTILTRAAEAITYDNWSDEFAVERLKGLSAQIIENSPELGEVQPAELTTAECDELGFGKWAKDNPMRLIPLWLLPYLDNVIKVQDLDGVEGTYKKEDMDDDHRYGYLAYGVIPKDVVMGV